MLHVALKVRPRRHASPATTDTKLLCRVSRIIEQGTWFAAPRNVSRRGIGLLINRPVKPGAVLAVQLPIGRLHTAVTCLVRVQRVEPRPDSSWWWYVGGPFVRPLTSGELNQLRTLSPSIMPSEDQRTTVRHVAQTRNCPLVRVIEMGNWTGVVRSLSASQIVLLARRPFKPDTVLTVTLANRQGQENQPRLVRVASVQRTDSGLWLTSGTFLERVRKG